MTSNNNDFSPLASEYLAMAAETGEPTLPIPSSPSFPPHAVPMPISSAARRTAAQMANLCPASERREPLRRNLLAELVVHDYLRYQGYIPDLAASDCWHPILGRLGEVADLVVSQVGKLECCAFAPGEASCTVLAEGQFNRAGYIAVELDAEEHWGWLLGFLPGQTEAVETLDRETLSSMDDFGEHLHRLWLLWNILQGVEEPWDPALRIEMVTLLERIYRTRSPVDRPVRAASEITQEWGEALAEGSQLVGVGDREESSAGNARLKQFLRDVFDQLEDQLEEEAHE
jgi:Protein of unknown function (DUF1822)